MLLSHNFDLTDGRLPWLDRAAFTAVFKNGLAALPELQVQSVDNPHWVVEVRFPAAMSAASVGELCVEALVQERRSALSPNTNVPAWLLLGGLKTTPPTSSNGLQTGEWGVDVVETADAAQFLAGLGWDATVAQRDPSTIFKVQR